MQDELRHDGLQGSAKVEQQGRAVLERVEVYDAVHRVVAVVGVQRCETQVAGLRVGKCHGHGFLITDLADQNAVGRLAHCVLQRNLERLGVGADLALVDDRLPILEDEFDGIFQRQDVT